jgi:hypothetical protein
MSELAAVFERLNAIVASQAEQKDSTDRLTLNVQHLTLTLGELRGVVSLEADRAARSVKDAEALARETKALEARLVKAETALAVKEAETAKAKNLGAGGVLGSIAVGGTLLARWLWETVQTGGPPAAP